jgi:hypothetical protein
MTTKEAKTKTTYTTNQLKILLLREAFERDLSLFHKLVTDTNFFGSAIPKDWTFTVVRTGGQRELFVNVPQQKNG